YSLANLLGVQQEFAVANNRNWELMRAAERRRSIRITVSSLVNALDQITSLLKFNGQKEGGRDVDSLRLDARLIVAAGSDLIGPKRQTASVRLSIENIVIV